MAKVAAGMEVSEYSDERLFKHAPVTETVTAITPLSGLDLFDPIPFSSPPLSTVSFIDAMSNNEVCWFSFFPCSLPIFLVHHRPFVFSFLFPYMTIKSKRHWAHVMKARSGNAAAQTTW